MQDRRKVVRTAVVKEAKLLLGSSSVINCLVRDLTNGGAGVEIPNSTGLPETLDLTFNGGRSMRHSRRVWRDGNRVGLEFFLRAYK